ncbi:unnamed protein product [Orchesella dallaii]|uniref:F-box domain-containing protein n=1 Tax=Orchesella dallaii TaxID=48710 RepID=A0ABP1RPH3_9HEXA
MDNTSQRKPKFQKISTSVTAATFTEAPAQSPFTTSGESITSVSKILDLDDLQPELMEIIFSNLCDDHYYQKDLLTCRAVNQRWKSIINGMMERACRQSYLSLQPTYQLERNSIIPSIGIFEHNRNNILDFARGACPKFIVSQGRRSPSNPFFSRSLRIRVNHPGYFRHQVSTAIYQEFATSGFISNFAHQLTYLTICDSVNGLFWRTINISVVDLLHTLSRTPNLKGFVLEDIEVIQSRPASRRRLDLPALPELTSLKIYHSEEVEPREEQDLFDGLPLSCWLLKAYSKQLTCIQVDNGVYDALTLETYPKLQELRFEKLDLMSLLPSEKLPLRRLIIKDVARVKDTPDPFMKLANFFHCFEDTLEHLELPSLSGFGDLQKHLNLALKKTPHRNGRVLFPKLKVFGFPYTNESKELALLKHYFLPKFMALETIEVMGSGMAPPVLSVSLCKGIRLIRKFLVNERCWEVSRKLKTVRLFPDFDYDYTIICVKDMKDDETRITDDDK